MLWITINCEVLRLEFPNGVEIVNFEEHIFTEVYEAFIEEVEVTVTHCISRGVDALQETGANPS